MANVFITTVTAHGKLVPEGVDILEVHTSLTAALESIREEMVRVKASFKMEQVGRNTLVSPRGNKLVYAVECRELKAKV